MFTIEGRAPGPMPEAAEHTRQGPAQQGQHRQNGDHDGPSMQAQAEGCVWLDGYVVEDQVGLLLRRAHQRHTAIFAAGMAAVDLTPMQFTALIKIVELGAVTQNQLGRLAAMDPATIQGVVRRLMARGLVRRHPDPMDRRTLVLVPTEAGRALAADCVVAARRITETTLAPLDEPDRRALLSLLRKMG